MSNMRDAVGLCLPYGKASSQYETEFEPATSTVWGYFNPKDGVPCYSVGLLKDILEHDQQLVRNGGGMAYGTYFERRVERILDGDFSPTFMAELMLKDVGLALELARASGVPSPMLEETRRTYDEAVRNGWGREDFSAVTHVIEQRIGEYESMLEDNAFFLVRTQGVGVISPELAQEVGVSGPLARGSGLDFDLRRYEPYSSYEDFDFKVPVETAGDCFARYRVRMVEFRESIKIVRQALDGLPEGPISSRPGVKSVGQVRVPKGEGYSRIEGARGEVGCYLVADGGPKPYRLKWRGASFSNLAVLPHIIPGHKVADVVAIMGSVDPVFGEVDR